MKLYHRISVVISLLCLGTWVYAHLGYRSPGAHDGQGPDPLGVMLYLAAWVVGGLLLHSTLVSTWLATSKRNAERVREGGRGLWLQAAGWAVLAFCVWPWLSL
ncbi:putative membrane protein [Lysobacter antibioticus]|jgi:hypothetical protein|uniref:hypothetical protein n=1 Tax=Lysobacter antibioticus TaxID=84531 RepID=UPI0007164D84|nr:hypothetical protein [Lysobacter antibioticus]ALN63497.1 putative membrane protein [Lysobacter antibioticus]